MPGYSVISRAGIRCARDAVRRFVANERGTTAIEYSLVAGFISIAIVSAVGLVGTTLRDDWYQAVADALAAATGS